MLSVITDNCPVINTNFVKTIEQIQAVAEKGDYVRVAKLVGKGSDLVNKVISGKRKDHHNIQRVFSDMLESREKLAEREAKRRARKNNRLAA